MDIRLAFVGFGEAGTAFGAGLAACGYDRQTDAVATRDAKHAEFAAAGIRPCADLATALDGATAILSLVTADQALAAAVAATPLLGDGALWFDMNSVAPDTKRAAALAIEAAGGRYVDVAVMAPVLPARRAVPLLVGGPYAASAAQTLRAIGFGDVTVVDGPVGAASSIKLIRSVLVKGLEALTAECVLAAEAASVRAPVIASLDASWPGTDWAAKTDYNLDRMMRHGLRRAAEMEEAVKTLDALGTGSSMTRGTVARQRAIGALGLVPAGILTAKISQLSGISR